MGDTTVGDNTFWINRRGGLGGVSAGALNERSPVQQGQVDSRHASVEEAPDAETTGHHADSTADTCDEAPCLRTLLHHPACA